MKLIRSWYIEADIEA